MNINIEEKEKLAYELFESGCNCSQAVFCAFSQEMGIDTETAMKLSSSFGGGMGRLREVCGTVCGMFMVAGMLYGYDDVNDPSLKIEHYKRIRSLAYQFEKINGNIVCRNLLKLDSGARGGDPSPRDAAFKHARPCYDFVRQSARIIAQMIENDGNFEPAPYDK